MLAGDFARATAMLYRLLHHCHAVQIDGRNFRLAEIEKQIGNGLPDAATASQAPGPRPSA